MSREIAEGWFSLQRSLLKSDFWTEEPFTRAQAWVDMIGLANFADSIMRINGRKIPLQRGQIGWTEEALGLRWKWSRGKVRRFLQDITSEGWISQEMVQLKNIITICNYNEYQKNMKEDGTLNSTLNGTPNRTSNDTTNDTLNGTLNSTLNDTPNGHRTVQRTVHRTVQPYNDIIRLNKVNKGGENTNSARAVICPPPDTPPEEFIKKFTSSYKGGEDKAKTIYSAFYKNYTVVNKKQLTMEAWLVKWEDWIEREAGLMLNGKPKLERLSDEDNKTDEEKKLYMAKSAAAAVILGHGKNPKLERAFFEFRRKFGELGYDSETIRVITPSKRVQAIHEEVDRVYQKAKATGEATYA